MKIDRETLIAQLVRVATVDKSVPPAWKTDDVIWADEQLVAVANRNWPEMVAIATEALALLEDAMPEPKALIKLSVLNGRRRDDFEDPAAVQRLFDEVKEDISRLEEGSRKQRCYTFFLYQQKVFGARCGFYAEAAKAAEAEAALSTKPEEKAISMYLARVYAMWAGIMSGVQEEIDKVFLALKAELPLLQQGVAGTALEIQWGKGNGPIHLLQAMIMTNTQNKWLWDENMNMVLDNAEKLGNAFKPFIGVLVAERSLRNCDALGAIVNADREVIENPTSSLADKAWAHLIMARAQSKLNPEGAAKDYREITAVPDGHMVAAVAARELAQLISTETNFSYPLLPTCLG